MDSYLNGEGGYTYLTKKYNIPDTYMIRRWVNAYNGFGDEGLLRSRKKKKYTFEFKISRFFEPKS